MKKNPTRILLVEDNPLDARLMGEMLADTGAGEYVLQQVELVSAALQCLSEREFDVVLLDLTLTDSTGFDTFSKMQKQAPEVPIILLTGVEDDAQAIKAVRAGAQDYLVKGRVSAELLVRSIRYAIERKLAGKALRLSEAAYKSLVDIQSDVIARTDLDGRLTFVNDSYCKTFGKTREELIGKVFTPTVLPEDLPIVTAMNKTIQSPPYRMQTETRHPTPAGIRWFSWDNAAVLDRSGKAHGLQGIGRDITDRKQAEQALRENEARYRAIFEGVEDAIFVETPAGRILDVNQRACEMFGYTRAQLLSKEVRDLVPAKEFVFLFGPDDPATPPGHPIETINVRANGERFPIELSLRMQEINAEPVLFVVVRDITERKQAEERLSSAEQKYHSIFENALEAIHQTTCDGNILTINPAGARMLGFDSPEELMSTDNQLNSRFYVQPGRRAEFQKLMEANGTISEFESEVYRKDGSTAWISENAHSVCDIQGNLLYYEGTSVDITKRKQAENALHESELLLRALFELSPDSIILIDPQTPDGSWPIVDCNETACRMNGYERDELIGQSIDILNAFPAAKDERKAYRKQIQEQDSLHLEAFHRHKNGTVFPVEISTRLIQVGTRELVIGIDRDITERKHAELELQVSHAAEKHFSERLATLSEITTELSKTDSLEALCRRAVELGRERLDFDRLSIWFLAKDRLTMLGTYGTDVEGQTTDERKELFIIGQDFPDNPVFQGQVPLLRRTDASLALHGQKVGQGMHVSAGLWDGKEVIGYISVDNLLRQRPISDRDCEIIRLYASALGHLCSLKRAGLELQASHSAEKDFSERLAALSEVSSELSKADGLDGLCRRAVELGRERLGFDRLSIFFLSEDSTTLLGTFGVDSEGRTTDERQDRYPVSPESNIWPILKSKAPLLRLTDVPLLLKGQVVGQGMHIVAGLWDGITAIGYIAVDNLLRQQPFSDRDSELIHLYASALGHLISLKRIEATLRLSEEKFRKAFMISPDAININRLQDGMYVGINNGFTQIMGYTEAECIGKTSLELDIWASPDDRKTLVDGLLKKGEVANLEACFCAKNGDIKYGLMSASLLELNNVPHIISITRDITGRKQADQALHESEERFRKMFTEEPIGMALSDKHYHFLQVNPSFCQMLGYTEQEFEKLTFKDLTHPEDVKDSIKKVRELENGIIPVYKTEKRYITKNKAVIWGSLTLSTILDQELQLQFFLVMIEDITERKQAQEALRESEERFRFIFENANDSISITNAEDEILSANRRACEMLGYSLEEMVKLRMTDIQAPEVRQPGFVIKNEVLQHADSVFEGLDLHRSGRRVPVEISVGRIEQASGDLYVSIVRDITERRLAEESLARQTEELRQRNRELDRLYRASVSLLSSASASLQELAQTIVGIIQQEFGQANCSLLLVQRDSNELQRLAAAGPYTDLVKNKTLTLDGPGLVPQAFRTGQTVNVGNVLTMPGYLPNWESAMSEMTVPLKIGSDVIGVLDTQSSLPDAFNQDDERLMTIFAERAALALEHSRLYEQTEARVQQLAALRTVDMAISSSFDIHLTLDILLDQVRAQLGVHAADILGYNQVTQTFWFSCGQGFRTHALQHTHLRLGEGYAGKAAMERRLLKVPDLHAEPSGFGSSPLLVGENFISYAGVPLIAKGQIKGVLEIFHRQAFDLTADQQAFLELLAGQAGIAMDNAELYEHQQRSIADLTIAYNDTLEGWASALELRDKVTEGHTRRVTDLTIQLARALGVDESEQVQIYRGALLHDIGKIGVPDAIVLKPGPLTDAEWVIMRQHPLYAYNMLSPIGYLREALNVPYCHHEKWDGTGYPRGLKGEEIPLAARIFSVVDVWDALTSDRPYRKAWTHEKARLYIIEQSGAQFEPKVVETFLREILMQ